MDMAHMVSRKLTPEQKEARRAYSRKYREENWDKIRDKNASYLREWRRKNPGYRRPNEQVSRRDLTWLWYTLYKQDQTSTLPLDEQLMAMGY
jgi:hypothetical protein